MLYRLERIPQNGDTRKDAIARLKARGIDDKKDKDIQRCFVVGEKIWIMIQAELDSYFLQYKPPQIQTVKTPPRGSKKGKRKRKRNGENTGELERRIPEPPSVNHDHHGRAAYRQSFSTALEVLGSEAGASPQHGLIGAATPSQDPKDSTPSGRPKAVAACGLETGNSGNISK